MTTRFTTYVLWLVVISCALAAVLRGNGAQDATDVGVEVLSLSSPRSILANESHLVVGGLFVPDGTFEVRLSVCSPISCTGAGWGTVTGPAKWWGYLGELILPVGVYEVYLSFFPSTEAHGTAIARFNWRVVVH